MKTREWCKKVIDANEQFENVIFSNECTVQLDQYARLLMFLQRERKTGIEAMRKHPVKVHV